MKGGTLDGASKEQQLEVDNKFLHCVRHPFTCSSFLHAPSDLLTCTRATVLVRC